MNTNPKYEPIYEDWLRKDDWTLDDAVYLLWNLNPELRELFLKKRRFNQKIRDTLDTVCRAEGKTLTVMVKSYSTNWGCEYGEVKKDIFIKWAKKKKYEIPAPLQHLLDETDEAEKPTDQYSNLNAAPELLKTAFGAWTRIWVNGELGNNPLQKTIIPWLVDNYKVTSNEATAIDKIIRTKKRKKGALNK